MYPTEGEIKRIRKLPRGEQTNHFVYHLLLPKILGYWAFLGPKHKGIELADVLVWWEDVVLLLEAKTRGTPDQPKESWIRERLREAIESINHRADMLKRGEVDVLRSRWRGEVRWDPSVVKDYYGIVVMHHNSDRYDPLEIAKAAFSFTKVPIAVISLYDFMELTRFESTAWDLITYFEARFQLSRKQRLLVQDEFEIYQSVWSYWPELTAGHGTEEQAKEVQKYQFAIGNALQRSDLATEDGYARLAASLLLDYCLRSTIVEADRDDSGKPVRSSEHDFIVNSIGSLAEISRLRRTEYGMRWLDGARKVIGTSQASEKMSYSPSRDRGYLFVAFGEEWSTLPLESYLARRAREHMRGSEAKSCLCLGAWAKDIICTYEAFLAGVKKEDSSDRPEIRGLPYTVVFVTYDV